MSRSIRRWFSRNQKNESLFSHQNGPSRYREQITVCEVLFSSAPGIWEIERKYHQLSCWNEIERKKFARRRSKKKTKVNWIVFVFMDSNSMCFLRINSFSSAIRWQFLYISVGVFDVTIRKHTAMNIRNAFLFHFSLSRFGFWLQCYQLNIISTSNAAFLFFVDITYCTQSTIERISTEQKQQAKKQQPQWHRHAIVVRTTNLNRSWDRIWKKRTRLLYLLQIVK